MADPLLHVGAAAQCPHGGTVSIQSGNTRVKVGGQAVALVNDTFTISACPFQIPIGTGTKPQPCVSLRWVRPATRVKVNGQPVILKTSSGLCQSKEPIPQGPPKVMTTQMRVKGI